MFSQLRDALLPQFDAAVPLKALLAGMLLALPMLLLIPLLVVRASSRYRAWACRTTRKRIYNTWLAALTPVSVLTTLFVQDALLVTLLGGLHLDHSCHSGRRPHFSSLRLFRA
jgi:hypothetical protein